MQKHFCLSRFKLNRFATALLIYQVIITPIPTSQLSSYLNLPYETRSQVVCYMQDEDR